MKVVSIVGARPQFIKLKPVHEALVAKGHEHTVIHTGQHYDHEMSDDMFADMGLPEPDICLGVGPNEPPQQAARMVEALEREINGASPDCVLVYGDTTTTLAGALASSKLRLKTGHVEAGLRSYDPQMLEEVSRRVADRVCQLLFAPTANAVANLEREGLGKRARLTGDVMLDAFLAFSPKASALEFYRELGVSKPYILVTLHRAENVDRPETLRTILENLNSVSEELPVVFPIHPRTMKRVAEYGLEGYITQRETMRVISPVGYLRSLSLLLNCALVITDSGGLQKEAFFARKPCITLRDRTEWPETLEQGANRLVPSACGLAEAIRFIIENPPDVPEAGAFGNGNAGMLIAEAIGEA
jgi:UDP-N-acetylglucosamine 2-epimerase